MPDIYKIDGGRLHYDLRGSAGDPVVLLIEGLSAHMLGWRGGFCQPFLDAGYQVLRLDNRDVGLSAHYPGQTYELADMADDVHQLLNHLGLASVHVVGQSMGGMISQELVLRHPEAVASLTLLYTSASLRHLSLDASRQAPRIAATRAEAVQVHVEQERVCASRDYTFDEAWKRHLGGLMYDRCYDPAGVGRQTDSLLRLAIPKDKLRTIAAPTLIIHGTTDRLISYRAAEELAQVIPGSDLWLVEGMGHDLPVELWGAITSRIIANTQRADSLKGAER